MGWAVAIHGGAGAMPSRLSAERADEITEALGRIVDEAAGRLDDGGTALDVSESAVIALEECAHFNAGRGSVLTAAGDHELEASIMDGQAGTAGAACCLRTIRNPIRMARQVMERTGHCLVGGRGAEDLARAWALERVPNEWFTTPERFGQLKTHLSGGKAPHHATVGAVVVDSRGRLASATSTGGMTGKVPGRIGDTPIIGGGYWADSSVAVSCTGIGELFMRAGTARLLAARMALLGESLEMAASASLEHTGPACGGLIAVDATGGCTLPFNAEGMYRAWATAEGTRGTGIGA